MTDVRSQSNSGHRVNRAPASAMPYSKGQGHGSGAASSGSQAPEHPPQKIARTPELKGQSGTSPHCGQGHRENDPGGDQVTEMVQYTPVPTVHIGPKDAIDHANRDPQDA
jgi:hypothetical protein